MTINKSRAQHSLGISYDIIYQVAADIIKKNMTSHKTIVDVGCGKGNFSKYIAPSFDRYIGVDIVQYEEFPKHLEFVPYDVEQPHFPIQENSVDVVCAIEVIEHLENPRQLVRNITRILKPNGFALISTPNQLSLLSKLTLVMKNQFNAFQEGPGLYPTHISALVEIDLKHIFQECQLRDIAVYYTDQGRIPFTGLHWPGFLKGRAFSDNIYCLGWK